MRSAIQANTLVGWSHDSEKKNNAYNDQQMFERFVEVVNSQTKYNSNDVNAVPILIWHKIDNSNEEYSTSANLFDAELKYLHDNGFTVLTMADLVYDDPSKYLKINGSNNGGVPEQHEPIPNNHNQFAASVTDIDEGNDNLSTEEGADLVNEETTSEGDPPATKVDDDTITDDDSKSQLDEEEEDTEGKIPSSILQFILEP
jgi:hypothetical protein